MLSTNMLRLAMVLTCLNSLLVFAHPNASKIVQRQYSSSGQALHPSQNVNMCLDVQGNNQYNGAPVQMYAFNHISRCAIFSLIILRFVSYDCNGSGAQMWSYQPDKARIQLAGTNYCLDASSSELHILICPSNELTFTFQVPRMVPL